MEAFSLGTIDNFSMKGVPGFPALLLRNYSYEGNVRQLLEDEDTVGRKLRLMYLFFFFCRFIISLLGSFFQSIRSEKVKTFASKLRLTLDCVPSALITSAIESLNECSLKKEVSAYVLPLLLFCFIKECDCLITIENRHRSTEIEYCLPSGLFSSTVWMSRV